MTLPLGEDAAAVERALVSRALARTLEAEDLYLLLQFLNTSTCYRYTGVYRFEPGWVVSVVLFDREHPATRIGANVKMKESYCWLTGLGGSYVIEDACCDARLSTHAARDDVRSYQAVLLRDTAGTPWGTLCHFDHEPRATDSQAVCCLERFRPLIEELFVRDQRADWSPDAPSTERAVPLA